jgi:hypothetical protein
MEGRMFNRYSTYKGQMGGDVFSPTDWYKLSVMDP